MIGKYYIKMVGRRFSYDLSFNRRVTVIQGQGATGKTYFIERLKGYLTDPKSANLRVDTNIPHMRVLDNNWDWESNLSSLRDTVLFADEDFHAIRSGRFADLLFASGCYLVCVTRNSKLGRLNYAVSSIYEFVSEYRGKFVATTMYRAYIDSYFTVKPDLVITEDTKSGRDIISHVVSIQVLGAGGRDLVDSAIKANMGRAMYIIVDGAAYGAYIAGTLALCTSLGNVRLFAPESMEYLILNTFAFKRLLKDELTATYNYAEASVYNTWENYYEDLLRGLVQKYWHGHYNKESWKDLYKLFKSGRFLKEISDQLYDLTPEVICIQPDRVG